MYIQESQVCVHITKDITNAFKKKKYGMKRIEKKDIGMPLPKGENKEPTVLLLARGFIAGIFLATLPTKLKFGKH